MTGNPEKSGRPEPDPGHRQSVAVWLASCATLFIVLMAISIACYPGGNNWSETAGTYDFWRNFWCDLLIPVTRIGDKDNFYSMIFGMGAMLAFAVGSLKLWYNLKILIPDSPHLANIIRFSGLLCIFGLLPMVLTAGHRWPHAASMLLVALSGWLAAFLAVYALTIQYPRQPVTIIGWVMIFFTALDFILYVREVYFGGEKWVVMPAMQKIATIMIVLWFLSIARLFSIPPPGKTRTGG